MLRAVVRQPAQRVLAVECASRHAEVSGTNTADAQIKARLRLVAGLFRQRVPARVEMRQKRCRRFDRDIVTELQLRRIRPACEPLQSSPYAGRELGRIAEPRGFA